MRVLVVDDERLLVRSMQQYLRDTFNFETVDACYDGFEAVKLLGKERYDLVILDLEMPKRGGLDVLEFVDKIRIDRKIHVVMISGNFTKEAIEKAASSTSHFLSKPFKVAAFEEKLKLLYGKSA